MPHLLRATGTGRFYVALREAERRVLRDALIEFDGDMEQAAAALELSWTEFRSRARTLGGVFPDQPRNEPPKKWAPLSHDTGKKKKHASNSNDRSRGISGDPGRENESGVGGSGTAQTDLNGEG